MILSHSSDPEEDPEISEVLYPTLHLFKSKNNDNLPPSNVFMTEVIHPSDPRSFKFGSAKTKEIEGLIKRGTFKVALKSEMPDDPNVLGGRFDLSINDEGTKK